MAREIRGFARSYEVAGDMSGNLFRFVKLSGKTAVAATAATDPVVGVLQNKPTAPGIAATVMIDGLSRVVAAKAIAAGTVVYIAADGRVTDTAASNKAVGIAEDAATAAGDVISVLLKPLGAL
ncbi:hypothetical protein GCM10010423_65270 [Streptomyces levis]|uniref:DUF2190 domain-containing protein n=1 Tax=Streptomyces levis TaxID=285566 RepID=A0ABN3P287_9ACTN